MKLAIVIVIIVVIVVVLYFLSKTKVIHFDSLDKKEQDEIINREKIRSMLMYNHIRKVDEPEDDDLAIPATSPAEQHTRENFSADSDSKWIPPKKLLKIIKKDFINDNYQFNLQNLPRTTRYPSQLPRPMDKKLLKLIESNINELIDLLRLGSVFIVDNVYLVIVEETEYESLITANIKTRYLGKTFCLEVKYYCRIERSDDFNMSDEIILQLIKIKHISLNDFNDGYQSSKHKTKEYTPFISMEDQLNYVQQIDKMHKMESQDYQNYNKHFQF